MAANLTTTEEAQIAIHRTEKAGRLYILPQLLANLTQSIGTHRKRYFAKFFPELTTLCMEGLKFSDSFLCVFMSGFRVFVC